MSSYNEHSSGFIQLEVDGAQIGVRNAVCRGFLGHFQLVYRQKAYDKQ
jgi:hypothetical protein